MPNINHTDCRFVSYWLDESVKIFMQLCFVVTFLSLFFFLYVVNVEKDIFVSQIDFIVDNLYDDFQTNLNKVVPPEANPWIHALLLQFVDSYQPNNQNYQSIEQRNQQVLDKTKTIVITFCVIMVSIVAAIFLLRFCTNVKQHIIENLIVLCCMGLTEFLFLTLVTRQYLVVNPNRVKYYILDAIQQYAQSQ